MKIRIAGAGAGKTTSMAETIIHLYAAMEDHLKIFCITFTNSAAKCVNEKLKAHYGCIPDNIVISTIHSFLYQEFVRPYHYLLYGKQYERISIAELPDQYEYKNSMIRRLESKNVLHQTVIPERAKWVVVKKTKDTKKIREKRSIILNSFRSYCGAICIDEAQDIDKDMYEIIKSLSTLDIPMILMGDPKQDLKGHKYLRKLVEEYPDDVEYSTICHRCPQKHLNLSNLIIPDNEKQHSEKNNGSVVVYFASEKNIAELIDENNFDLKYISKKQGIYDTHTNEEKEDNKEALCEEISIAMRNEHPSISDLTLMRGSYYLAEKLLFNFERCKDKKSAMNQTFSHNPLNDKKALVDADSQCNLTMYALGADKFDKHYIEKPNDNIYNALIPAFKSQPRLIQPVDCPQINENLFLLPGHLDFTENEVQLGIAMQLSSAFGSMENLPGAINYLIEETARKYSIDYVIYDMNPSLSAINQDIFVCSDYFILPSSPDLFSLMSIDSLCRVLSAWETWAQKARPLFRNATYPLPMSTPIFLGYTINDFNLSHGHPQYTFKEFMDQISSKIVSQLIPALHNCQMVMDEEKYINAYNTMRDSAENHHINYPDPYCLAQISNFNKLIALSNAQSIPVFEVVLDNQLMHEGQSRTLAWFNFLYGALATRILELTSHE